MMARDFCHWLLGMLDCADALKHPTPEFGTAVLKRLRAVRTLDVVENVAFLDFVMHLRGAYAFGAWGETVNWRATHSLLRSLIP
jgi:hypothetical protein